MQQIVNNYVEELRTVTEEKDKLTTKVKSYEADVAKLQEAIIHLNEEAEDQNLKIMELRQLLRNSNSEMGHIRDQLAATPKGRGRTSDASPLFDASLNGTGSFSDRSPRSHSVTRSRTPMGTKSVNKIDDEERGSVANTPRSTRSASRNRSNSLSRTNSVFNFDDIDDKVLPGERSVSGLTNSVRNGPLSLTAPVNWLRLFREDVQRAIDEDRCRILTINETKEIIDKLYESKALMNEKNLAIIKSSNSNSPLSPTSSTSPLSNGQGIIPIETLEQHTYRIMEKKYGLRSLAVEHVGMLIRSIELYSKEDNNIKIFLKIFRNEIEEDYRYVQYELLKSINDLTLVQLMGRHPTKSQESIKEMLKEKIASGIIYEDEWKDMINYLYNESDSAVICLLLRKKALMLKDDSPEIQAQSYININGQQVLSPTAGNNSIMLSSTNTISNKIKRSNSSYTIGVSDKNIHSQDLYGTGTLGYDKNKLQDVKRLGYSSNTLKITVKNPSEKKNLKDQLYLSYSTFISIVLDFQLQSHCDFLSQFLILFRQYDTDTDGVLNAGEFKDFYHDLRRMTLGLSIKDVDDELLSHEELALKNKEKEEELHSLFSLLKIIDPLETDRIIFSNAVIAIQKIQQQQQEKEQLQYQDSN